ncbi:alpha-D-ribose 1-methylphosphonate 5-triphosphate diphosphatase [Roseovarius pelagicus]|uniref:Alpha-D-ribose 1-methylphosphonate 5-triphosphate diphosphatase n=1 Tax=Roseovarius pelagicus TaxID=2980108 RepID=A0ABY6D9S9_9RHOB|nr:alpha-D-ribose 1-methylphosphonate 5-triphosphate diphosphatase [Roseovarius pelagicus]UXX82629.1 alpha-D-ribose 1-methylphosphonate 5-triphosphate diphosphatase [Roseovarius pelagicus]
MTGLHVRLTGADVLTPDGLQKVPLILDAGRIADGDGAAREVDLSGYIVLPGIVDVHGDGFERHLAPRRGAMKDIDQGLVTAEAELAANGITTAVLAQFYSWEGGMRGPEFAERVMTGVAQVRGNVVTDLHTQLRFETPMLDDYGAALEFIDRHSVAYCVFNDHLPHVALEKGKQPKGLIGKSLRIGRNPEVHLAMMQEMHARRAEVPAAVDGLSAALAARGVRMGSHDDRSAEARAEWRARGATLAEFPETLEAAEAARAGGDAVIMGAPNVVRGGSHNGNVSAADMVMMGLVDALASDYHYPSLRRAAFFLLDAGVCDLATAWGLISAGPARILGLSDRGALVPGMRADLLVLEMRTRRVAATLAGGRISYLQGDVAQRFLGG